MKNILRHNKGFTLIEMVVVLGIVGAIMATMAMAVQVIYTNFNIGRDDSIALRQVQNAGYWISNDIKRAKTVSTTTPGVFLRLICYNWDDINQVMVDTQQVDYTISNGELSRTIGSNSMLVAQYIVPANTTVAQDGTITSKYNLTIQASFGAKTETRSYQATQRVPG